MSIKNAMTFISKVDSDKLLRTECYKCKTKQELLAFLQTQFMLFTEEEFEEAINIMLFKCQSYEDADKIKQVEAWFTLFH
nr:Nif11 family protein [uncultured Bacteroides sp.]